MPSTLAPIALGLFSAVTLAVANVAIKRGGDILAGRAVLSATSALLLLPAAFFVPVPDPATWAALALAVPVHFAYQSALVRAMHRGDLSLVFPVMRGLAPLLTALSGYVILGEALAPLSIIGLLVATGAVVVFALPPPGLTVSSHPDRTALLWAALTAGGVALYNVMDARGVRIAPNPFTFIVWLFLLDWIGLWIINAATRGLGMFAAMRRQLGFGAAAGTLSILSYGAAMYAFTLTEAVMVSALRETAVVFGALLGWVFLKEGFGPRRVAAAAALAGGLALMQIAP